LEAGSRVAVELPVAGVQGDDSDDPGAGVGDDVEPQLEAGPSVDRVDQERRPSLLSSTRTGAVPSGTVPNVGWVPLLLSTWTGASAAEPAS
jgi:hypothetical protein